MKEVIISDGDKPIQREELSKKIEKLDVYIGRAENRIEKHLNDLEKISDKYRKERDVAEDFIEGKKDVKMDL